MNKKLALIALAILTLTVLAVIYWPEAQPTYHSDSRLTVTTSFYPLYYFSARIVGDKGTVLNITPAGAEPHDYEPTAQDIAQIEKSDILVLTGTNFEPWGKKIMNAIDPEKTSTIEAEKELATGTIVENGASTIDPHVWLSPRLTLNIIDKIAEGFMSNDPENASYYEENARILREEMAMLDAEYAKRLENCKNRNIITSHAAFGYLASSYNLTQTSITGISPDAEPSPKELAAIAQFAKDHNVQYIFFEKLASPKLAETIADEVGAKTLALDPLEGLGENDISSGKNYITEMKRNLETLTQALQCTP